MFDIFKRNIIPKDYIHIPSIPDSVWQDPLHFIAFGFGIGTIPFAPGTFGTLLAALFYLLTIHLSLSLYCLVTAIVTLLSILICHYASAEILVSDHQGMCLDELPGFFITMIGVPFHWYTLIAGFILFRIFDIIKPWPIRYFDRHLHGGFGMVFDDVLAGMFAFVMLHLFLFLH